MKMKFTASVVMAIEVVMRLVNDKLWMPLVEQPLDKRTKLDSPKWEHFDFFREIEACPVRKKGRVEKGDLKPHESCPYWEMERKIRFFYLGIQVAVVTLEGKLYDSSKGTQDNVTFWSVARISYAKELWKEKKIAEGWQEFRFHPMYSYVCISL